MQTKGLQNRSQTFLSNDWLFSQQAPSNNILQHAKIVNYSLQVQTKDAAIRKILSVTLQTMLKMQNS